MLLQDFINLYAIVSFHIEQVHNRATIEQEDDLPRPPLFNYMYVRFMRTTFVEGAHFPYPSIGVSFVSSEKALSLS